MDAEVLLKGIEGRRKSMIDLVIRWSEINSGSYNLAGLGEMAEELKRVWSPLADNVEEIDLEGQIDLDATGNRFVHPIGKALVFSKRKNARFRILFSGHYDTVYSAESDFQKVSWLDDHTLRGPGVTDMKGGLVVMLEAVRALEASDWAEEVGWDVVLNPDEEVGSMGSAPILIERAKGCSVGLVFEPSYPDGTMVSFRKGSSNFSVIARGKSAHAGRDFHEGKNAVAAIAGFMARAHGWNWENGKASNIVVNCARIDGGGAANVVPDMAIGRFNVRFLTDGAYESIRKKIESAFDDVEKEYGVKLEFFQQNYRSPKPFDEKTENLFNRLFKSAGAMGMEIRLKDSGGVCDGNILSQAGLPNIDTMGVRGGKIHTHEEYLLVDSLTERAKLTASFLLSLVAQPPIATYSK
jgi:glutamate carboxypeptidase